jgi:hypothetical protein
MDDMALLSEGIQVGILSDISIDIHPETYVHFGRNAESMMAPDA